MHSGLGGRPFRSALGAGPAEAIGPNFLQINNLPSVAGPSTSLREGRRLSGAGRRRSPQPLV